MIDWENPYINYYKSETDCGLYALEKFMTDVEPYLNYDEYETEIDNAKDYFKWIFCSYLYENHCEYKNPNWGEF